MPNWMCHRCRHKMVFHKIVTTTEHQLVLRCERKGCACQSDDLTPLA